MLEWLKTPSGAYNLTFIVALFGWLVTGAGIVAGFHLNKVRTMKALADKQHVEQTLKSTQQKLLVLEEATKPKPLKVRVRTFLERLDQRIIAALQAGQIQFVMMLTYAQAAELQVLAQEDGTGEYIAILPNTNIMMNEPGKAGQFSFRVSPKLIE